MNKASYKNYGHYMVDEWKDRKPKEMFANIMQLMGSRGVSASGHLLDIGCAGGEFLYYLSQRFPSMTLTGADVFDDLLECARQNMPDITFRNASVLGLPSDMNESFDVVTAVGVMSIFDEMQIESFWDNLLRVTKPGGHLYVLSPLNEFGVDAMIRHRKRMNGQTGDWETGWNIFARETIEEILSARGQSMTTVPFNIPFELERRDDPIRTWTMKTANKERQLTNGLKLLVDHQIMMVKKA